MQAEKVLLETDTQGNVKNIPVLPANKKVEAIFLIVDDLPCTKPFSRSPHQEISGKVKIHGDIIDCVPVEDWDLPE